MLLGIVSIAVGGIGRDASCLRGIAGNYVFLGRPIAQINHFAAF